MTREQLLHRTSSQAAVLVCGYRASCQLYSTEKSDNFRWTGSTLLVPKHQQLCPSSDPALLDASSVCLTHRPQDAWSHSCWNLHTVKTINKVNPTNQQEPSRSLQRLTSFPPTIWSSPSGNPVSCLSWEPV